MKKSPAQPEWLSICQTDTDFRKAVQFWKTITDCPITSLGEIIAHGIAGLGKSEVARILEEEKVREKISEDAFALAELPVKVRRTIQVPTQVRLVIARAKLSPLEAAKWLKVALDNNLSALELERSIEANELKLKPNVDSDTMPLCLIQSFGSRFQRWFNQVCRNDPMEKWSQRKLVNLRDELTPIVKVCAEIDKLLSEKKR